MHLPTSCFTVWQGSSLLRRLRPVALGGCIALLLLGSSCRDSEPSPQAPLAMASEAQIRASWPWQAAFGVGVSDEVFEVLAQRWLGGVSGTWPRLGAARVAAGASLPAAQQILRHRSLTEDRLALRHLGIVHAHASCRLASDADAFGAGLAEAYLLGAAACESLGDVDGAEAARANAALRVGSSAADPNPAVSRSSSAEGEDGLAALLVPEVKVIDIRGERLKYLLLRPAQVDAALALLGTWLAKVEPPKAAKADVDQFLAIAAGTSQWSRDGAENAALLPVAESILASAPAGPARLAQVESLLEDGISLWHRGLAALPREGDSALDAGGRSLLDRWFRRALYREVGLLALDEGDADLALLCLEEAAEARGRVRPAPGLDPLLLAALARARYECNELQRSVQLLDEIAAQPGWGFAGPTARTIARVAVVGSGPDAKVNR